MTFCRTWGGLHLIFSVEGSVYARVTIAITADYWFSWTNLTVTVKVLPYALFSTVQVLTLKALEAW